MRAGGCKGRAQIPGRRISLIKDYVMKKLIAFTAVTMLLGSATASFAADGMTDDGMSSNTTATTSCSMGSDGMKHKTTTKTHSMKKDGMMKKDTMSNDGMSHDDSMSK